MYLVSWFSTSSFSGFIFWAPRQFFRTYDTHAKFVPLLHSYTCIQHRLTHTSIESMFTYMDTHTFLLHTYAKSSTSRQKNSGTNTDLSSNMQTLNSCLALICAYMHNIHVCVRAMYMYVCMNACTHTLYIYTVKFSPTAHLAGGNGHENLLLQAFQLDYQLCLVAAASLSSEKGHRKFPFPWLPNSSHF
jgi:hypothetical protein